MDLHLSTTTHDDYAVVHVSGEVDIETAPQLSDHVLSVIRDHSAEILLDLSQVPFMDSTGLQLLLSIRERAELAGGGLALVGVTRPVMKVLDVTGLVSTFALFDDAGSAVERVRSKSPAD
ncbi:MAG: STAS domain-containing protein [Actinomycetes bacterium]